ncbi:MAG: tRNA pseudouridine(38-40) synthase TruA [Brevinematales bacterium]|nr:tRNA pseudouridine(38-40) synthase TruA [Brevinematales bacterium]
MNIRLDIAYDGSSFFGWQRQKDKPSVQAALEEALSQLLGENIRVSGSGRTDAGAHAFCYTTNFHCGKLPFPVEVLPRVLLSYLPSSIVPLRAMEVEERFHARFSAMAREYVYVVWKGKTLLPFFRSYVYWMPEAYERQRLEEVCSLFVGEHNFRLFCYGYGREEKEVNFCRTIEYFRFMEKDQWLVFFIKGNGFLRGMIRTLVGVSLQVGIGTLACGEVFRALQGEKDIPQPLKKAVPAAGLYFKRAYYSVSHKFDEKIENGGGEED